MKQISLIINIALAIALGVLYYLHFSSKSPSPSNTETGSATIPSDIRIAFINADTVLKYYDFFKESREKLEAKGQKMDTDFRNRAQGLQREITNYQNTVANLTIGQARALEEDLTKKQQNLRVYQESLAQELSVDEGKLNQDLYLRVTSFLKDYSAENNVHAVLKFDVSSDLLFANENMDITQEVIDGLNGLYQQGITSATDTTKVK